MQIIVNSPHEPLPDTFVETIERSVHDVLAPFAEKLTRVEIHFKDLNAGKGGIDKRCAIEARPRGLKPLAVDHEGARVADAFRGALHKLQRVLEHRLGRLRDRDSEPRS